MAYSDYTVEEKILEMYNNNIEIVNASTENVIYATRVLIKDGKLDYRLVEFYHDDIVITTDINGKINHYPKGFNERVDIWLDKLIGI